MMHESLERIKPVVRQTPHCSWCCNEFSGSSSWRSSPTPDEFGPPAPLLRTGGKKLDLVPSDDPPRARGGLCLHFLKSTRSPLHQYKGRPEKMIGSLFLRLRSLDALPPLNQPLKKNKSSPFHNNKNRRNCPILSFLEVSPEREQLIQQIQTQTKLDHLARGGLVGLFERMLIISKKLVSSHFPESQSYYSTLAKLMMKEDLDLSALQMMMSTPGSMRLTKENYLD
ncbi:hypothetical protein SADUNF_SadunfMtG0008700 (mitochondrion) [Salix dunnii]|uniref:Uncharacterized protein n=1 Tax=Salix dunnii TaxID=1413687 RepID=A0A835MH67_9ROSI|nr:hypothetical protein SADUNF_SadunfMtG0008700 [Salix dunnii]